jgi:hypothetical protein
MAGRGTPDTEEKQAGIELAPASFGDGSCAPACSPLR